MALQPGKRLGPYEIVGAIGAGGMGEVYRARDTRLERDVAVKVLPQHLANDPRLKQRFEREARTVSSLNHPHICALYDVGHEDGTDYLVMEYLEGETLAARVGKGALPTEQVLRYGIEVADALDKAHRRGVVHRDLKPGNVILTAAGAKVLDFCLAKSAPALGSAATLPGTPTQSSPLTAEGAIVGTFQYMSPEQLEGRETDARSDIFSFGAVLYEMATARKAFPGKSQYSVASAILEKDPEPITALQPMTPPALERLVMRCLAKDPENRWQTARDLAVELKWISEGGTVAADYVRRPGERSSPLQRIAWGVAAVSLVLAAALSYATIRRMSAPVRPIRSFILPPEKVSFAFGGYEGGPVLSPDGTRLVFPARDPSGKEALWVRPLDSLTAQRLEGTEDSILPFWSPDSRTIGFFAGGKLKKIDAEGGPAQTLCDAPAGRGGAWSEREVIVFAPEITSGLSRVSVAGGTPTEITHLAQPQGGFSHRLPTFLPDGRHFLYWGGNPFATNAPNTGIFLGALDSSEQKFLAQAESNALYASPGYLLYLREQTLMAQPFDAGSLKLKGDAFPVAEHISSPGAFRLGLFTISRSGLLVYQTGQGVSAQFLWLDLHGNKVGTVGEPGNQFFPRLSPNGARLAYVIQDPQSKNVDIWITELARSVQTRFTFDPAADVFPVWSPDGSRIVFASARKGHNDLYVKDASGAASEELLYESDADKFPTDWSRDGRFIVFDSIDPKGKTKYDIGVLPLFGDRKPIPYLQTQFNEMAAAFSPDGHWLAYESDETGSFEIYLAPFPAGGGNWQVSQGGGVQPAWKQDGSSLFYLASPGKLMEIAVKEKGSSVEIGVPHQVFQMSLQTGGPFGRAYSVAPNGQRILVNALPQGSAPEPLTLVVNWTAGLKK
jgi:serine/threonine protein kinase/Tol biopolymer transport system component